MNVKKIAIVSLLRVQKKKITLISDETVVDRMVLFGLIEFCRQSHVHETYIIINTYSFSVKTLQKKHCLW